MSIPNFNPRKKVFIIAEVGNNHEGNFDVAKKLIRAAAKAGADAVKFQTFVTNDFVNSEKKNVQGHTRETDIGAEAHEKLKHLKRRTRKQRKKFSKNKNQVRGLCIRGNKYIFNFIKRLLLRVQKYLFSIFD